MPNTEKSIVTTDAMENFVSKLKEKVFNWNDPSGTQKRDWEEGYSSSSDSYNIQAGENFKLIPAKKSEIDSLFEGWNLTS